MKETKKSKAEKVFETPKITGLTSSIVPAPLFDINGIAVFNGQIDALGNLITTWINTI